MAEKSNLVTFFGDNPFVRLIDAFIDNVGEDYSKKEIQELAELSKGALFKHWNKLERLGLVKVTRAFGNTKLYTLNKENKTVKDLMKLEMHMIDATTYREPIAAVARNRKRK